MAGRIRTIKPEWLEDEKLAAASLEARLLSVALILLADDHGRGRANVATIAGLVFALQPDGQAMATRGIDELQAMGFIHRYMVRGQTYFAIVNWTKHQKVDRPSPPRCPPPDHDANGPNVAREPLATGRVPAREPLATDHDHDHDHDHDQRPSTTTPAAATPDRVPLADVAPHPTPKVGPLVEVWHMLEPRGFSRDVVTSCLHRWHGPKETLPLAIAYVLAHLPADARAGLVIDACSKADPVLVADWDRAGRPPRTSPKSPPERQTGGKLAVYVEPPPDETPDQRRARAKAVADAARAIGMGGRPFTPPGPSGWEGDPVAAVTASPRRRSHLAP